MKLITAVAILACLAASSKADKNNMLSGVPTPASSNVLSGVPTPDSSNMLSGVPAPGSSNVLSGVPTPRSSNMLSGATQRYVISSVATPAEASGCCTLKHVDMYTWSTPISRDECETIAATGQPSAGVYEFASDADKAAAAKVSEKHMMIKSKLSKAKAMLPGVSAGILPALIPGQSQHLLSGVTAPRQQLLSGVTAPRQELLSGVTAPGQELLSGVTAPRQQLLSGVTAPKQQLLSGATRNLRAKKMSLASQQNQASDVNGVSATHAKSMNFEPSMNFAKSMNSEPPMNFAKSAMNFARMQPKAMNFENEMQAHLLGGMSWKATSDNTCPTTTTMSLDAPANEMRFNGAPKSMNLAPESMNLAPESMSLDAPATEMSFNGHRKL